MSEARYIVEIEIGSQPLSQILPQLEIVAKHHRLKLKSSRDFRKAKSLLYKCIYNN